MTMNEMKRVFSDNLVSLLKTKGWSQAELGRRTSLARHHINSYIQRKHFPSFESFVQISKVLNCSPDALCPGIFAATPELPLVMRQVDDVGGFYLRVARVVDNKTAFAIADLLNQYDNNKS